MTNKKKILVITRNYPPLWGGMERLNQHLVEELSKRFDVCLIAPNGANERCPDHVRLVSVPLKPLSVFLVAASLVACKEAKGWRPDVIIAGSGLTAPLVWLAAKLCSAKTMAYTHGLDLTVAHPLYRMVWFPALRRLDKLICNSNPTASLARSCVGVKSESICLLHPGVDLPDKSSLPNHKARQKNKFYFCKRYGIKPGPLLLSVGRLTERKGLREFVHDVLPIVVAKYPDTKLIVIGDSPTDSLYAGVQTIESIDKVAKSVGVDHCVYFIGKKFGDDLCEAYRAADIHVFPVRELSNDPEGFGMVAIEAAANGLPTVAYATGGVIDAVEPGVSGKLVEAGNYNSFANAINDILKVPFSAESVNRFATSFGWKQFGTTLEKIIKGVIN